MLYSVGLLNHQSSMFNVLFSGYFLYDKNSYHERAQECPLYLSKVFLWKIFCMKSAKMAKKYRLCQVNFMTFIFRAFFFCTMQKNAGKVQR